jgi:FMN phosphatase YigB (HAD superfamily)
MENHTENPKKPWIIFDLDHTLFDTTEFKKDIFATLKAYGVNNTTAQSSFKEFVARHDGNYDILSHCEELLQKKHLASLDEVRAFLASPLEQHLFRDAKKILRELRARGYYLVLLTKGIERFQNFKIERTGLKYFFAAIKIVEREKEKGLAKLSPPNGSYFVNDREDETERVMHAYPNLEYILFTNPNKKTEGPQTSIRKITSLQELLAIIP